MAPIRWKHRQPANERDFEILCLRILRKLWNCPTLELWGHRGEEQEGIDILDTGGSEFLRAAQCKLYDPTKTLSPAEIRKEVATARSFRPALSLYVIMTTAKVSTKAQKEIIQINREHQEQGLFNVELKNWESIEILLDEYSEVREITYGPVRASESLAGHSGAVFEVAPVIEHSGSESIDATIEEACGQLQNKNAQLARFLFQRLRQQKWDKLSQRQKFRVLSNIGVAYVAEGNSREAIPLFLEAKTHQPDDEHALANEVLAYLLGDKVEKAFELATEARKKYPNSASILRYWLRAAPLKSLEQLQREVPALLENDPDVCLALAERANNIPDFAAVERLADVALKARPDWVYAKLLLAESISGAEALKADDNYPEQAGGEDLSRLRLAEKHLTEVIAALGGAVPGIEVRALLVRSETRRLLGESQTADADVMVAREIQSNEPSVLCGHAQILLNSGDRGRALAELRQAVIISNHRQDTVLCLARALAAGSAVVEREEAVRLFIELGVRPEPLPTNVREHAIWHALQLLGELKTAPPDNEFLSRIPADSISAPLAGAYRSKLALLRGEKDEASRYADEAIAAVVQSTTKSDLRILVTLLSDLGRHSDALDLLQRIADCTKLNLDTRNLLDCATRLARHDVTLQVCEQLRLAGVDDPDLVSHEAAVRLVYEPESAIQLLQNYLSEHNHAKAIRLQLYSYALQRGKDDLIKADRALLPGPEELDSSHWHLVVRVLRAGGNATAALEFAYQLLRHHYSKVEANLAYIEAFLPVETAPMPAIEVIEAVQPGAAVCFVEAKTTNEQWRIIEDMYPADELLGEVSPDHFFADQVLGKKVGDTFLLSPPGVAKRTAVVRKILSKYVLRYQECTGSFQVRFPNSVGIEMVRVGPDSNLGKSQEMDVRPILSAVDIKEQVTEGALHKYSSEFLSVNALATMLGQNVYGTMISLASREDVKIKCCIGSGFERNQAAAALEASNAIVLDLTAIATVSMLGLLKIISVQQKLLIVSRATLSELEQIAIQERRESGSVGALGKHGGRYVLIQETKETKAARIRSMDELINWIKSFCSVLTCLQLASIQPERRRRLVNVFGQHGAESMVLAAEPGRVLWTDDYAVAYAAQTEFGVRRVWTQAFLQHQVDTGKTSPEVFFQSSAKLMGCGYYFTGLNLSILL